MGQRTFRMEPFIKLTMTCSLVLMNIHILAEANSDRVLLKDVNVLTLYQGQMTKARRAEPVPQLKCLGGSAGCTAFKPQVVQCYNRGFDGYDVQWECKTDMDNSYRFGPLEVTCEGYSYPDDPYILRGSCGLEYTLELTEEGYERKNTGYKSNSAGYQSNYGGHQHEDDYHYRGHHSGHSHKFWSICSDLFKLGCVAFIIYMVYKCCIATPTEHPDAPPSYEETFRQQRPGGGNQPPPYGFRQDYMPGSGGNSGDSCSGSAGYTHSQGYTAPGQGNSTGGGFWSGAFTGGLLGYMFGNRNSGTYYRQRPYNSWWGGGNRWGNSWGTGWGNNYGTGWGNSWGSGSRTYTSSGSSGSSSSPSSSGTRTASGFGGTRRR